MLDIPKGQALRDPAQLKALIEAVVAADPHDEGRSVEWKSFLDLNGKEAAFSIARTILGMGNRHPDHAAVEFGGVGYMVVGAQPGGAPGIETIDGVDLANKLSPYLGTAYPHWSPQYIAIDAKSVLVVVVEPPKWGDPMWLLRKTYGEGKTTVEAGAVFVRGPSKTARATPDELDMLVERRARQLVETPVLNLEVVGIGTGIIRMDDENWSKWSWVTERKLRMSLAKAVSGATGPPNRDIEEHLTTARDRVTSVALGRLLASSNALGLMVTNPTDRNLPAVQMVLRTEDANIAFAFDGNEGYWSRLPAPPLSSSYLRFGGLPEMKPIDRGSPSVQLERPKAKPPSVRLRLGDVRPRGTEKSGRFFLLARSAVADTVTFSYTLTSTGIDAVQEGKLEVPVKSGKVALADVVPVDEGLHDWPN